MKKLLLAALLVSGGLFAQVPKRVLVEHFTNSRCSICASRNPALFQNLNAHPDVMHLAFHPSSPYSSCIFSQHNPTENDARANYYGVYGGTPRIVINGTVDNTSFGSASLFTSYQSQMSEFDVRMTHQVGTDSVRIRVVVQKVSSGETQYNLSVGVAEDTVFYNAPNGENLHRDVFRRFAVVNSTRNAPSVGDSVVYHFPVPVHAAWNPSSVYAFAMLQNPTSKAMLQSGRSSTELNTVGMMELSASSIRVYPVPASDYVNIDKHVHFVLSDLTGRIMGEGFGDVVDVSTLSSGVYILQLNVGGENVVKRIVVE